MPGQARGPLIPQVSSCVCWAHHKGQHQGALSSSLPLTHASLGDLSPSHHPLILPHLPSTDCFCCWGLGNGRVQLLQHPQGHRPQEGGGM